PAQGWNLLDIIVTSLVGKAWNWTFGDAIESGRLKIGVLWLVHADEKIPGLKGTQDFIGVNYYTGDLVHFSLKSGLQLKTRKHMAKNDLGWDIYPKGFARILKEVGKRWKHKSVIITENGIADAEDAQRPQFILDHLKVLAHAMDNGLPVEGY